MNGGSAILFLATAAGCYATAWGWGVMVVDAWRRRHWAGMAALVAAGLATAALCMAGPLPYPARPAAFLLVAAGVAAAYYFLVPHAQDDWKRSKLRREDARQVGLHLALLTGCILFSLPY